MSDRKNFFHGQIVTEGDMDGAWDDTENAEFNTHLEANLASAAPTDTPSCTTYGGILKGLAVTGIADNLYVAVSLGAARDQRGYRCNLPATAYIAVSHAGSTDEGEYGTALVPEAGDGAAINLSCPAGGRIVADLYIVYDEALSDARTDASGSTVYFEVDESFHFYIAIGTNFANPPVGPITVATLETNRVLLAQIVLRNDGGTMKVVTVVDEDGEWDALGAHYEDLLGRRGDWLSLDQDSYPLLDDLDMSLRWSNPRDALWRLVTHLLRRTSGAGVPAGSQLVGTRAIPAGAKPYEAYSVLGLTAGNIDSQLEELRQAVNRKLSNGGDNVRPTALASVGLSLDPTTMDNAAHMLLIGALSGIGIPQNFAAIGKKRGHIALPHMMFDDFMYVGNSGVSPYRLSDDALLKWASYDTVGVGDTTAYVAERGGIIEILTGGNLNDERGVYTGLPTGHVGLAGMVGWWYCGASPFAIGMFRFKVPSIVNVMIQLGFIDEGAGGGASSRVLAYYDHAIDNNLHAHIVGQAAGTDTDTLLAPMTDAWHTVRMAILSNTAAEFQLDNGSPVTVTLGGGDTLNNDSYSLFALVHTRVGSAKSLLLDQAMAADGVLASDML